MDVKSAGSEKKKSGLQIFYEEENALSIKSAALHFIGSCVFDFNGFFLS